MLKIKIDKKYVEDWQMDRVKADVAEFKECYTIDDLKIRFMEETGKFGEILFGTSVINYQIEAFDSGWACGNHTQYSVNILLDGWKKMYKVSFYISQDFEIDLDPKCWNIKKFVETSLEI